MQSCCGAVSRRQIYNQGIILKAEKRSWECFKLVRDAGSIVCDQIDAQMNIYGRCEKETIIRNKLDNVVSVAFQVMIKS